MKGTAHSVWKDDDGVAICNDQDDHYWMRLETRAEVAEFIRHILRAAAELWPVHLVGKCSWFGGPDDDGVSSSEGLAFIYEYETHPHLFLAEQPDGTTGLARRLNPDVPYVAARWDYEVTPKSMLANHDDYEALVRNRVTGQSVRAYPADWGPHEDTDRVMDVSPAILDQLGVKTDDELEVIYPVSPRQVAAN